MSNNQIEKAVPPAKTKFSALIEEMRTLDMENYGNWSMPIKAVSWVLTGVAVFGFSFFLLTKPAIGYVSDSLSQRDVALDEYQAKMSKLKHAEQYKAQLEEIERNFSEQLKKLPKDTEIAKLLENISVSVKSSGLTVGNISSGVEIKKEYFIEQPINIMVSGDFHSFGALTQKLAELDRIVNIVDFKIYHPEEDGIRKATQYELKASTYRYLDAPKPDASAPES